MSATKGDRRERELVNKLDEDGWAVMRAPSSGSATKRDLPDLLASNGDQVLAIEAKASSGDPIYIDREEVVSLEEFASTFGADARLAVRFDYDDWYLLRVTDLYTTDEGNYRVKQGRAWRDGQAYSEVISDGE